MTVKFENSTVELIDSMGSDLSVCNAARVSFHKVSGWENEEDLYEPVARLGENLVISKGIVDHETRVIQNPDVKPILTPGDQKLIKYLAAHNHFSPFCHAFLSFRIKTHIVNARQLVKHQVGLSWNEVSRRYVDDEPTFFMPDTWRTRPANVKQGSSETETVTYIKAWDTTGEEAKLVDSIWTIDDAVKGHYGGALKLYDRMLESGVAPEQARGVLPLFMNTEWIWSGSLAAFARVYKLRIDPHAQKEVRDIAEMIGNLIPTDMQHSWAALTEN